MTPFPRLALGAHICCSGPKHPAARGTQSRWTVVPVLVVSAWLTWLRALSEVANSWWDMNQMLPIAVKQAGAKGAAPRQELIIKLSHIPAALGLILILRAVDHRFV